MVRMDGKVALVTGATSGIGQVTALELARRGAAVVLAGRSAEKLRTGIHEIQEKTGNLSVSGLLADLSDMSQVRELVRQFQHNNSRLDVLLNNAGGFFLRRQLSTDGYEKTFALNHLSYFLLTNLFLDTLKASAPARVVNVSSNSHLGQSLDFENLMGEKGYNPMRAYARSKLANIIFTYELARRLEGSRVTANSLHPGLVATNIWSLSIPGFRNLIVPLFRRIALSPQEGARTSIYLASSHEVEGTSGQYFVREKAVRSSAASYDREAARRLWEISEEMVRKAGCC